tara:strand:+ start:865 stop:1878 length:1014 start_codon:yes stop_codon:yes gene_type:complete
LEILLVWAQLIFAGIIIFIAAHHLVSSVDIISQELNLGQTFVGVLLLATATSLPELGTGATSILLVNEPELAAGDVFGSNMFNLLLIGACDFFWRGLPIMHTVERSTVILGLFSLVAILITSTIISVESFSTYEFSLFGLMISPFSIFIILFFIYAMYSVYKSDRNEDSVNNESVKVSRRLVFAINKYLIAAIVTFAAASLLSYSGDNLSILMNWNKGFVGTQFLAIATSLPEAATVIMAMYKMKTDLAVSNLFGSNLFNTCVVLFGDDLFLTKSSFWGHINNIHIFSCLMAILSTLIIISFAQSRGTVLVKLFGGKWLFPILIIGYISAAILIFRG